MRKVWGGVLAVTGFIACPCHLPLTLPLVLGVLGGAGIGGFIADNKGLVYGIATGYFIVGMGAGWYLLSRKAMASGKCDLPAMPKGGYQSNGRVGRLAGQQRRLGLTRK